MKKKNMNWKDNFKEGEELVLATCSNDARPNANIVISLGFIDGKLLIADCLMNKTINNLKENSRIVVIGGYYRIAGKAEIFTSGKYFKICTEKSKDYPVKNAIIIDVETVFDLDKMEFEPVS